MNHDELLARARDRRRKVSAISHLQMLLMAQGELCRMELSEDQDTVTVIFPDGNQVVANVMADNPLALVVDILKQVFNVG